MDVRSTKEKKLLEIFLLCFPTRRWINARRPPPTAEKRSGSALHSTLTRSVWVPPAPNTICRSVGSKAGAALNLSSRRIFATRVSPLDVVESSWNNRPLPFTGRQSEEHDQLLHELYLAAQKGITGHRLRSKDKKAGPAFGMEKKNQTKAAGGRRPPVAVI